MGEKKRQKMSDLHSKPGLFARQVGFEDKYPNIEEIEVSVEESGEGVFEGYGKSIFNKATYHAIFDCSNPICFGGGIYLDRILEEMVDQEKVKHEDREICKGYEGSPKGKRKYRSCANQFKVEIRITYKE